MVSKTIVFNGFSTRFFYRVFMAVDAFFLSSDAVTRLRSERRDAGLVAGVGVSRASPSSPFGEPRRFGASTGFAFLGSSGSIGHPTLRRSPQKL